MKTNYSSPDPEKIYADIFNLPRPEPKNHPRMSLYNRAAQFAPFAALTGYEDMIDEESRLTDNRIEPDEETKAELDRNITLIESMIQDGKKPAVSVTYFIKDAFKTGGHYETITETVRKTDRADRRIIFDRKYGVADMYFSISIDDILTLELM